MANKEITKVFIKTGVIIRGMEEKKMSFRELGERLGWKRGNERMLRDYIQSGSCPPYYVSRLCDILELDPEEVLFGQTIRLHMSVIVPVSVTEWSALADAAKSPSLVMDLTDEYAAEFLKRAVVGYEAWVPAAQDAFMKL